MEFEEALQNTKVKVKEVNGETVLPLDSMLVLLYKDKEKYVGRVKTYIENLIFILEGENG